MINTFHKDLVITPIYNRPGGSRIKSLKDRRTHEKTPWQVSKTQIHLTPYERLQDVIGMQALPQKRSLERQEIPLRTLGILRCHPQ